MRAILTFTFILFFLSAFSQYGKERDSNIPVKKEKNFTAGDYLKRSAYFDYGVIVFSGLSYAVWYEGLRKAGKSFDYMNDEAIFYEKFRPFAIGSIALTAASFYCIIASIHNKQLAGMKLNDNAELEAYLNPSGFTLALKF